MSRDYLSQPPTQVRRKDRSKEEDHWIRGFLTKSAFGTISFSWEGQPFSNSNIFVYDQSRNAIYFHTAHEGRTRSIIDQNPRVCLAASTMGRLLPAPVALEFSVEYSGVSVFGKAQVIDDPTEATEGLQMLLDKYFPHLRPVKDYRPVTMDELKRTTVFRIDIDSWVGKEKRVEPDFEGAFHFQDIPSLLDEQILSENQEV